MFSAIKRFFNKGVQACSEDCQHLSETKGTEHQAKRNDNEHQCSSKLYNLQQQKRPVQSTTIFKDEAVTVRPKRIKHDALTETRRSVELVESQKSRSKTRIAKNCDCTTSPAARELKGKRSRTKQGDGPTGELCACEKLEEYDETTMESLPTQDSKKGFSDDVLPSNTEQKIKLPAEDKERYKKKAEKSPSRNLESKTRSVEDKEQYKKVAYKSSSRNIESKRRSVEDKDQHMREDHKRRRNSAEEKYGKRLNDDYVRGGDGKNNSRNFQEDSRILHRQPSNRECCGKPSKYRPGTSEGICTCKKTSKQKIPGTASLEDQNRLMVVQSAERGMKQDGMMPSGMMPGGMMQSGMMQGGMMQSGMMPGGMMQSGMMQGGFMPGGMMQGGFMPGGMMQGGMMPGGMFPGAMQQRPFGSQGQSPGICGCSKVNVETTRQSPSVPSKVCGSKSSLCKRMSGAKPGSLNPVQSSNNQQLDNSKFDDSLPSRFRNCSCKFSDDNDQFQSQNIQTPLLFPPSPPKQLKMFPLGFVCKCARCTCEPCIDPNFNRTDKIIQHDEMFKTAEDIMKCPCTMYPPPPNLAMANRTESGVMTEGYVPDMSQQYIPSQIYSQAMMPQSGISQQMPSQVYLEPAKSQTERQESATGRQQSATERQQSATERQMSATERQKSETERQKSATEEKVSESIQCSDTCQKSKADVCVECGKKKRGSSDGEYCICVHDACNVCGKPVMSDMTEKPVCPACLAREKGLRVGSDGQYYEDGKGPDGRHYEGGKGPDGRYYEGGKGPDGRYYEGGKGPDGRYYEGGIGPDGQYHRGEHGYRTSMDFEEMSLEGREHYGLSPYAHTAETGQFSLRSRDDDTRASRVSRASQFGDLLSGILSVGAETKPKCVQKCLALCSGYYDDENKSRQGSLLETCMCKEEGGPGTCGNEPKPKPSLVVPKPEMSGAADTRQVIYECPPACTGFRKKEPTETQTEDNKKSPNYCSSVYSDILSICPPCCTGVDNVPCDEAEKSPKEGSIIKEDANKKKDKCSPVCRGVENLKISSTEVMQEGAPETEILVANIEENIQSKANKVCSAVENKVCSAKKTRIISPLQPHETLPAMDQSEISQLPLAYMSGLLPGMDQTGLSQLPVQMSGVLPAAPRSVMTQYPSLQPLGVAAGLPQSVMSQFPPAQPSGIPQSFMTQYPSLQPLGVAAGLPQSVMSQFPPAQSSGIPPSFMSQFPSAQPSGIPPEMYPSTMPQLSQDLNKITQVGFECPPTCPSTQNKFSEQQLTVSSQEHKEFSVSKESRPSNISSKASPITPKVSGITPKASAITPKVNTTSQLQHQRVSIASQPPRQKDSFSSQQSNQKASISSEQSHQRASISSQQPSRRATIVSQQPAQRTSVMSQPPPPVVQQPPPVDQQPGSCSPTCPGIQHKIQDPCPRLCPEDETSDICPSECSGIIPAPPRPPVIGCPDSCGGSPPTQPVCCSTCTGSNAFQSQMHNKKMQYSAIDEYRLSQSVQAVFPTTSYQQTEKLVCKEFSASCVNTCPGAPKMSSQMYSEQPDQEITAERTVCCPPPKPLCGRVPKPPEPQCTISSRITKSFNICDCKKPYCGICKKDIQPECSPPTETNTCFCPKTFCGMCGKMIPKSYSIPTVSMEPTCSRDTEICNCKKPCCGICKKDIQPECSPPTETNTCFCPKTFCGMCGKIIPKSYSVPTVSMEPTCSRGTEPLKKNRGTRSRKSKSHRDTQPCFSTRHSKGTKNIGTQDSRSGFKKKRRSSRSRSRHHDSDSDLSCCPQSRRDSGRSRRRRRSDDTLHYSSREDTSLQEKCSVRCTSKCRHCHKQKPKCKGTYEKCKRPN